MPRRPSAESIASARGSCGVMSRKYFEFWPKALPHDITVPATNLFYNATVAAARYPDKPFVIFFEGVTDVCAVRAAERAAGWLPAAGLRRAAGRSGAAGDAEQPAVHRRVLRHPARQRDRGAGQPDERHHRARSLCAGQRRENGAGRAGSLSADEAAARHEDRSRDRRRVQRLHPPVDAVAHAGCGECAAPGDRGSGRDIVECGARREPQAGRTGDGPG